jgi:Phospholipase_D-nuclease N-terminal
MTTEQILLLVSPLIILQLGVQIWGLIDLSRPNREVVGGNKLIWALVIVLGSLIGTIVYFVAGRK